MDDRFSSYRSQLYRAEHDDQQRARQCQWCKAKTNCKELEAKTVELITDQFVDLDAKIDAEQVKTAIELARNASVERVSRVLPHIELIETFCSALRARAEAELLQGNAVPGYKLVQGKKGNRAWSNEEEAITIFKSMRLKHQGDV